MEKQEAPASLGPRGGRGWCLAQDEEIHLILTTQEYRYQQTRSVPVEVEHSKLRQCLGGEASHSVQLVIREEEG